MKKRDGLAKGLLILIITTIAFTIVVMEYLVVFDVIAMKIDINQLARDYILEMETEGYMTESMRTRLQQELRDMGVTDIDMSGTSFNEVGYGNRIYLMFTCTASFQQINVDAGVMHASREEKEWTFPVCKMSTAKY